MNSYDLSIIIVNYKTRDLLKQLLISASDHLTNIMQHEIFVVDNDSRDGSAEMVAQEFPNVKLIASKENLGFSKANNRAIQQAKGDIILLLNPDTLLVSDNEFDKIIQRFRNDDQLGIVGGRVFDANLRQVSSYGHDPTPFTLVLHFTLLGKVLARLFPPLRKYRLANYDMLSYNVEKEVDHVNGCCFFIRRLMMNKIGSLDERYFMFLEETDLCKRAREAGWKVMYLPLRTVVHYGQSSTALIKVRMTEQFIKSLKLFYEKHYPLELNKLSIILKLNIVKPIMSYRAPIKKANDATNTG